MSWFEREVTPEEEQAISVFMAALEARAPDAAPRLPDADVLLVKAQLLRRWDAERRVQAPLDAIEPIQIIAGLAAAALLLFWSLPSLFRVFLDGSGF